MRFLVLKMKNIANSVSQLFLLNSQVILFLTHNSIIKSVPDKTCNALTQSMSPSNISETNVPGFQGLTAQKCRIRRFITITQVISVI